MSKKVWIGFIVVFIGMSILDFLIHAVILSPVYQAEPMKSLMRADMSGMIWIFYVVYLIVSFFFTLIFSKGYEGKGISEGIRYGLYVGILMATPMAYASYAMYPMPYSLALQWFLYGIIEYIILGILVAAVFGKKKEAVPAA